MASAALLTSITLAAAASGTSISTAQLSSLINLINLSATVQATAVAFASLGVSGVAFEIHTLYVRTLPQEVAVPILPQGTAVLMTAT